MTTLSEALDTLKKVTWRDITPAQEESVAAFLEQATKEVITREGNVTAREHEVSRREALVTVREEQVASRIKAIGTVERVRSVIYPALKQEKRSWLSVVRR